MLLKDILLLHKDSSHMAIKFGDDSITYKEMYEQIIMHVQRLQNHGIDQLSQNIGILLPNSIEYALAYFMITFMDRVIVPIGIQAKASEIINTKDYCELQLIITTNEYGEMLEQLFADSKEGICIYTIEDQSIKWSGESNKKSKALQHNFDENDVALMLYTSGTTSDPKRVMLTHKNLITNVRSNIESLHFNPKDKVLIALPMFFGYCNTAQFLTHLYLGASIIILKGTFFPKTFFYIVEKERITNFTGVPTMLLLILQYKNRHNYDISTLRYICFGGGVMPVKKLKELIKEFPTIGFVQTYGQTEAAPRVTCLLPEDSLCKVGSIGKAIPNVTICLVNENGEEVNNGEIGEILISGENVMKGYYKKPQETARVLKDGWLHSGDLAIRDDDGYIYLVGRLKNIIISGGINISPEEIEEILLSHQAIKDALVIGERSEMYGEVPIARVVLKDGFFVDETELINYCVDYLAYYKVPVRIEFWDSLPKTTTGKIKRY